MEWQTQETFDNISIVETLEMLLSSEVPVCIIVRNRLSNAICKRTKVKVKDWIYFHGSMYLETLKQSILFSMKYPFLGLLSPNDSTKMYACIYTVVVVWKPARKPLDQFSPNKNEMNG